LVELLAELGQGWVRRVAAHGSGESTGNGEFATEDRAGSVLSVMKNRVCFASPPEGRR
jgi:hypothetical protein